MSVMKMAMGDAEQQGEALQKLMGTADATAIQYAAQPHLESIRDGSLLHFKKSSLRFRAISYHNPIF
jgi:hypothetical protein